MARKTKTGLTPMTVEEIRSLGLVVGPYSCIVCTSKKLVAGKTFPSKLYRVTNLTPFSPDVSLEQPDKAARILAAREMFDKTAVPELIVVPISISLLQRILEAYLEMSEFMQRNGASCSDPHLMEDLDRELAQFDRGRSGHTN